MERRVRTRFCPRVDVKGRIHIKVSCACQALLLPCELGFFAYAPNLSFSGFYSPPRSSSSCSNPLWQAKLSYMCLSLISDLWDPLRFIFHSLRPSLCEQRNAAEWGLSIYASHRNPGTSSVLLPSTNDT
jgi:hypothetical protein